VIRATWFPTASAYARPPASGRTLARRTRPFATVSHSPGPTDAASCNCLDRGG
jgi:hypothetical protein